MERRITMKITLVNNGAEVLARIVRARYIVLTGRPKDDIEITNHTVKLSHTTDKEVWNYCLKELLESWGKEVMV
jgi:hypothetical protein